MNFENGHSLAFDGRASTALVLQSPRDSGEFHRIASYPGGKIIYLGCRPFEDLSGGELYRPVCGMNRGVHEVSFGASVGHRFIRYEKSLKVTR